MVICVDVWWAFFGLGSLLVGSGVFGLFVSVGECGFVYLFVFFVCMFVGGKVFVVVGVVVIEYVFEFGLIEW